MGGNTATAGDDDCKTGSAISSAELICKSPQNEQRRDDVTWGLTRTAALPIDSCPLFSI
jgi:hypothetical protein